MATVNKDFKVKNNISISNTADTATPASHYIVETGTDGVIRPKTLANVRTEIVTTASVNAAAATTVGTITSGVWQGSSISTTYTDAKVTSVNGATGAVTVAATNQTMYIGTTAVTINRASADLNLTGIQIGVADTRATVTTPETTAVPQMRLDFKQNTTEGLSDGGTYFGELTIRPYGATTDWSGGGAHQLGFTNNGNIWARYGTSTTWGSWKKIAYTDSPALTGTPTAPTAAAGTNTTQVASTAFVQTAVNNIILNTVAAGTTAYTLALTDAGDVVEMTATTANTVTIPPNGTVAFPIGTTIDIVSYGTGQTTIVAGAGVTLRSSGGKLKLTGQYSAATLYKRGTDEWVVMGDLSA